MEAVKKPIEYPNVIVFHILLLGLIDKEFVLLVEDLGVLDENDI
jgi:hypothetical protein